MTIKTIPLSDLEADLRVTLNRCADSGQPIVVELPDRRRVTIQWSAPVDPSVMRTRYRFCAVTESKCAERRYPDDYSSFNNRSAPEGTSSLSTTTPFLRAVHGASVISCCP